MARTAVVAGTATGVSNRVSRRQANRWAAQDAEQAPEPEPQYDEQPPDPAPATGGKSRVDELKDLAALKEQGALTEEEFESEKARILEG